jgi:hypothetical protein
MRVPIKDCGKGINKDLLPSELELGVWSGSTTNFRARNGFMEKWDGVSSTGFGSGADWLCPYSVGSLNYLAWVESTGIAAATNLDTNAVTIITPWAFPRTISTITRIGANTAEVTTSSAHGLSTNDDVTVYGATESGYNEANANITVMSSTVFRYTTTNAIASNATVVGAYIVVGGATTQSFTSGSSYVRSGGNLNGTLVFNDPVNGWHYWNGDAADNFKKFAFTNYPAAVGRVFKHYLIQLAPTMSGTKYPQRILWSNAAEPGAIPTSFTSTATNDAGFVDLADTPGGLVDCLPYGDVNIIYTEDGRYAQQYIGGNDVFAFSRLPGSDGVLTANCIVNTPKGQVFLTPSLDVKIHQGGEAQSIADAKVRKFLVQTIDQSGISIKKSFICLNPRKNEVWIVFPTLTSGAPDRILAWSWETGFWSDFDPPSTGLLRYGVNGKYPIGSGFVENYQDVLLIGGPTTIGVAGGEGDASGAGDWFGTAISGVLERTGMHLDNADVFKTIHRSRWNIDGDAGDTLTIQHGSSKFADTAPTYTAGTTYTIGTTDYADGRATAGRFLALKATTTAFPLSVRSIDLDVTAGGKR